MILADESFEGCRPDSVPMTREQWYELQSDLPSWAWIDADGYHFLRRRYAFDNFRSAFDFAAGVADLAEAVGHHPELICGWGYAEVRWWTHKISGIHRADAIMAARCDRLHERGE